MWSPSPLSVNASIHLPVSGAPSDAAYAIGSYLSDAKHEQETPPAQYLPLPAPGADD
jgi:hypothetical protein